MRTLIVVGIVASGVFAYGQTPASICGDQEVWLEGRVGAQVTSTGLRIPAAARLDEGVTFCIRGVVVRADETTMIERNGERTFTLSGKVTLTIPSR